MINSKAITSVQKAYVNACRTQVWTETAVDLYLFTSATNILGNLQGIASLAIDRNRQLDRYKKYIYKFRP